MATYFGKYRGTVAGNIDPMQMGRLQVEVPAVLGQGSSSWALPCAPFAGDGVGFFALPPVGANVWVEFEAGNPDYPIWAGCFWALGELPATPALPFTKQWQTDSIMIKLDDTPGAGGLTIEVGAPAAVVPMKLVMDSSGIELSMGAAKVKLTALSVSINDGAIEVI